MQYNKRVAYWMLLQLFSRKIMVNSSNASVDENSEWKDCEIFIFIFGGIFLTLLNSLGIFFNLIAILTFLLDKMKNTTTYLLIGLELADTLFLISSCFIISFIYLFRYSTKLVGKIISPLDSYDYVYFARSVFSPIITGALMASSWHTVLITLERYLAVCAPHSSWKFTKKITIFAQIFIFILTNAINIPRAWEYEPAYKQSTGQWIQSPTKLKRNSNYGTYVTVQYWLIQLAIPISTISYMTIMILKVFIKHKIMLIFFNKFHLLFFFLSF